LAPPRPLWSGIVDAFGESLRELGHVDGENIVIEYRWAEGQDDRLPNLAAELVRLGPDVIVTTGTPGTIAAKQATSTIPIVFASSGNPITSGLIGSVVRTLHCAAGRPASPWGNRSAEPNEPFRRAARPITTVLADPSRRFSELVCVRHRP
jgi:hypothetical protein